LNPGKEPTTREDVYESYLADHSYHSDHWSSSRLAV
jgi:hypothetical protein